MTDTSYYPPTASPRPPGASGTPGPVLVAIAGPARQRRATVAVRLILAIPHVIALYFLGIAAFVVAVIGWLGALVTGRLPGFAATYLSGYLRWYSRVAAYLLLLTDQYPPFAFEDAPYPVRLAVGAGRLNRLSVLFRLILAIPAAIVSTLLTSGFTTIVVFIAWLTALVAGRLPASLHQAVAAVLRYTLRYYGYLYLLTDTYPAGLFGDEPGAPPAPVPPPASPGFGTAGPGQGTPSPGWGSPAAGYGTSAAGWGPPSYDPPGYGAPGYGAPAAGYGTPGYGTPGYGTPGYAASGYGAADAGFGTPAYGAPAAGYGAPGYGPPPGYGTPWPPGPPAAVGTSSGPVMSWALVLAPGAKRLVGLILVLGLLTAAGEGAWTGTRINAARQRAREITQLNTEAGEFNAAVARHNAAVATEQQAASQVANATDTLSTANETLNGVLNGPAANANNCATVSCFNGTAVPVANGFAAFGRTLRATSIPPGSAAIAKRLAADNTANEQDWVEISQATSFSSIEDIATAAEKVGGQWDNDYPALMKSLDNQATALSNQAATLSTAATTLNREGAALNQRAAALNVTVSVGTANDAL
jgi:hypothetical protein